VPSQERPQQPSRTEEIEDGPAPAQNPQAAADKAAMDADVDAILDEIDDLLEENAEEFVRGFVQKGGQ
jgi:ubiquitin-like protein Pup